MPTWHLSVGIIWSSLRDIMILQITPSSVFSMLVACRNGGECDCWILLCISYNIMIPVCRPHHFHNFQILLTMIRVVYCTLSGCFFLTLGACARVTVVILCVCVCVCMCVCVCYLASCYILRWKSATIRLSVLLSMYVVCEFCWKCFVQKFWQDLLITSAFCASWWTLDEQKRKQWLLFEKTI